VQQLSLHARSLRRPHSTRASALYHTPSLGASGAVNAVVMREEARTFLLLFVLPMPAGVLAAPRTAWVAELGSGLGGALLAAVWVGLRRL